ncbi:hypothetical protein V0R37_01225 [Pollutimonas sp. H1-120]|uniref:hypothetical protein n=1 Tax=Pollutimonas sp. H1-120 TaxID=3148824 RepID=UPI003B518196
MASFSTTFFNRDLVSDFTSGVKHLLPGSFDIFSRLKDKFGDDDHDHGHGHGHGHGWPPPHGEAKGNPNLFRAELDDASGTITFVTELGRIPMQWSADGKAQAFRTGDTMTLALTGEILLTSPSGDQTFSLTPSDLLRLRDGLGDTGKLTLDDIREAAAPLIQFLADRGIDVTGAHLDGEVLKFTMDISESEALAPGTSLTEAFTNSTIDLSVAAQVMQNLAVQLVTTEGVIDLGTGSPIGQFLQEVIVDGGGTMKLGPITIEGEGSASYDVGSLTPTVDGNVVITENEDASLPGWKVLLGGGDDSLGIDVVLADDNEVSGSSANRTLDLGAGDNTLYLDGNLGMTIEAGKGDNWIQFTEQVSNLKDVGTEEGLLAGATRVVEFGGGDELVFGQHGDGADPRALTGDVLQGARVDVDVDAMATLLAKVETAAANVEVDNWTAFQHEGDTFVFVQNGNMSLESGDGLIQLVGYTGELNDSNFILPAAA